MNRPLKKQELSFEELMELAKKANLKKEGFSEEVFFFAYLYEKIIWQLAHAFSSEYREITHFEYTFQGYVKKSLFICLDISKDLHMHDFGRFIQNNTKLIPKKLRQMFDVYVGFNYRTDGGFIIKENDIVFLDQSEFDEYESENIMTDEIKELETYRALSQLTNLLFEEI